MQGEGDKMASPMAVAFLTKKALEVAQDKRIRMLLGSIIVGLITVIVCTFTCNGFYMEYRSRI